MSNANGAATLESMSQAVWYNRWTINKFSKYLNGDILEVGCGIGNFTQMLTAFGNVYAIDIDRDHVRDAQKLSKGRAKIEFGDIEKQNTFFSGKKFDTVICLNVLEHIEGDRVALENIYSLLKKGGVLILLVPAHEFLFGEIDKSIGHFRRYDKKSLLQFMTSLSFKIVKVRILNMLGAVGWWFAGKLLSNKTVDKNKVGFFNILAPFVLPMEDLFEPPIGTSVLVVAQK